MLSVMAFGAPGAVGDYRRRWPLRRAAEQGLLRLTDTDYEKIRLEEMIRHDVVLWNRLHVPECEALMAVSRQRSETLHVWDTDDLEALIPRTNDIRWHFWNRGTKTPLLHANVRNIRSADLVTTSTTPLAWHLRWFNECVLVLPNQIEQRVWEPQVPIAHEGPWLVFCGSFAHRDSLEPIIPAVEAALRAHPEWRLVLLGFEEAIDRFDSLLWNRIITVPFSLRMDYRRWLASAELAFRPSGTGAFSMCKSENPVLECGACGFALGTGGVGTPILAAELLYGDVLREAGLADWIVPIGVAQTELWEKFLIERMASSRRRDLTEAGVQLHRYVKENRLYEQHAHRWVAAYEMLAEGRPFADMDEVS